MFTVIETNPIEVLNELANSSSTSFNNAASNYLTGTYYHNPERLLEELTNPELINKGFMDYHKEIVFPTSPTGANIKGQLIDVIIDSEDTLILVYKLSFVSGEELQGNTIRAIHIRDFADYEFHRLDEFMKEIHKNLFVDFDKFPMGFENYKVKPIFTPLIPTDYKNHFSSVMLTDENSVPLNEVDVYKLRESPFGYLTALNILKRTLYKMKSIWSYQISEVLFQEMLNKYKNFDEENTFFSEDYASQLMNNLGDFMMKKGIASGALLFKEKDSHFDFSVRLYGCIDNDEKPDHADEYDDSYWNYDCELITTYNCNLETKESIQYTVGEPMIYYPMVDESYDTDDNRYHKFIINLAKLYGYLNP